MKRVILIGAFLGIVSVDSVMGGDAVDNHHPDTGIEYENVEVALAALRMKGTTQIRIDHGWTVVEEQISDDVFAVWSFTPKGHPAHPTAVKRIVYESNGNWMTEMAVLCQSNKAACDSLVEDFKELTQRMIEHINSVKEQ